MNAYENYLSKLKNKFGVTKLENQASDDAKDLQDLVNEREREEQARYQFSSFATTYKGAPLRIYYDKSRVQKVLI